MLNTMLKHLYIVIGSTFVFGIISGVLLFLITHLGNEGGGEVEQFDTGISVVAKLYGGCQMAGTNCPSYRIANDGSYAYVEPTRQLEPFKGELSGSEWRGIRSIIRKEDFLGYNEFTGTCPVAFDGVAYVFEINMGGDEYIVDSCLDDIEDIELYENLKRYFKVFQNFHKQ